MIFIGFVIAWQKRNDCLLLIENCLVKRSHAIAYWKKNLFLYATSYHTISQQTIFVSTTPKKNKRANIFVFTMYAIYFTRWFAQRNQIRQNRVTYVWNLRTVKKGENTHANRTKKRNSNSCCLNVLERLLFCLFDYFGSVWHFAWKLQWWSSYVLKQVYCPKTTHTFVFAAQCSMYTKA